MNNSKDFNFAMQLIRMIGLPPYCPRIGQCAESEELFDFAFRNRIAFLYLDALESQGRLDRLCNQYERLSNRYNKLHVSVRSLTHKLEGTSVPYVLFKTMRYYPEIANDIDLLLWASNQAEVSNVVRAIESLGYRKYDTVQKYNFNRVGKMGFGDYERLPDSPKSGDESRFIDLDIYLEVMVEEIVYFDKEKLRGNDIFKKFRNSFDGKETEARVFRPAIDLFTVLIHSIFPTRNFSLDMFFTTIYNLEQFTREDFDIFVQACKNAHLCRELGHPLGIIRQLFLSAFEREPSKLDQLLSLLGWENRFGDRVRVQTMSYPFVYDLLLFLKVAGKAAFHFKGIVSFLCMVVKSLYPPYAYNIVREVLSTDLARRRHTLKF